MWYPLTSYTNKTDQINSCKKNNIPTAKFGIFKNKKKSITFLKESLFPIVIKADNIASGKGVYICKNKVEAVIAIEEIFNGKFGEANVLLIEEFLIGEEMCFFTIWYKIV